MGRENQLHMPGISDSVNAKLSCSEPAGMEGWGREV